MADSAWQLGAVLVTVAAAAVYLARRIFLFLSARSPHAGCSACGGGEPCHSVPDNGHVRRDGPRSLPLVFLDDETQPSGRREPS